MGGHNQSLRDYHLRELEIARKRDDPRWVMPEIHVSCRRVLDVGCGAGQTLVASELPASVETVGVELDAEAIRIGRELFPSLKLVRASGEQLPFPDRSFDFVFSRVAMPYMDIPVALREMHRVLMPGGGLWLSLHSVKMAMRHFGEALRSLNPKGTLYQSYVFANGLLLHATGKTMRWHFSRSRCESFQTDRGIRKALLAQGFVDVNTQRGRHFVVTAKKPL